MNNINIFKQILKDFSLSNYNNLFKGETRGGQSKWYLIDTHGKRKSPYSLSDSEWKYSLTYNQDRKELLVGSYEDILDGESKSKVLGLLKELDNKYDEACRKNREMEKDSFVRKIFG